MIPNLETTDIELPLSGAGSIPASAKPKIKIKKEVTIREADNGYILRVSAGYFNEEWVFGKLSKAIKAIVAFLNTTMTHDGEDEKE